jgi:hypothetical protein
MRIRTDSVSISSALFTVALVFLVPTFWANVITQHDKVWLVKLEAGQQAAARTMSELSVISLGIILIGLIVIWTGYKKRVRWSWLVMSVVVWVWAFRLLVYPLFEGKPDLSISEWLYTAIYQPGLARLWAKSVLIFLVMVVALFLPIRSFFFTKEVPEPTRRPSPRFIGFSVTSALLLVIVLFAWVHVRIYELPLTELNSTQRLPPPPPPPSPYNAR